MTRYPEIDDERYYDRIEKEFQKYKIPKKKRTLQDYCFPKEYALQIPQKFVRAFMNPDSPYTGLLVLHDIGAGKTCAGINIAEGFKRQKRILFVVPASLKDNVRDELRTPCTGEEYLTNREREQLKKMEPGSDEYFELIETSNSRIDKYYTIMSHHKFIKLITEGEINLKNTLLIIDEIHNMVSETGKFYEILHKAIQKAPASLRVVIMTATPIYDKPHELPLTMNLLLRDKQMPTGRAFYDKFMDIQYFDDKMPKMSIKNKQELKGYLKGYISYYRGAPPHVYPEMRLKYEKVEMSDFQYEVYRRIEKKSGRKSVDNAPLTVDISNSFLIGTRVTSNIAFPNGKANKSGFNSLKFSDYEPENLLKYMPKFLKVLKRIEKSKGTVFVYSNFKEYGGVKSFSSLLEQYGYLDFKENGKGRKRFAVWSGDEKSSYKRTVKSIFNHPNNVRGAMIRVIIGSPSIKEGVSLLRVKQIHLLEPYWNMSRMKQVIGRGFRFCSHKDVPEEERYINVYVYVGIHPKLKRSVDQHILELAITKDKINQEYEQAIKEAAVDCRLFYHGNVYPGEVPYECDI